MILWVSYLGLSQLHVLMCLVSHWASWVLDSWSGLTSAGASCLCSMKSLNPHQYSLGLHRWQLIPREQSPALILTTCHFCHILLAKSSHRGSPDSKDREIDNTSGLVVSKPYHKECESKRAEILGQVYHTLTALLIPSEVCCYPETTFIFIKIN